MRKIQILDTTLREGEQTPGVSFPVHVKLRIARLLEQLNVDIVEAGHPVVSKNIKQGVIQIANTLSQTTVAAHARTDESDVRLALECGANFLGIFYCVSENRLQKVFNSSLKDAIDKIQSTISFAREYHQQLYGQTEKKLSIRYTPEDTVRSEYKNVRAAAIAAAEAGADVISIADTTGYMIPHIRSMYDFVSRIREDLDSKNLNPDIAVHCHNDRGFALANAIDGVRAGASIVDASVLGLGERAGIVDLAGLLISLPHFASNEERRNLEVLTELYELVSEYAGVPIPPTAPIVGENAFTHCAGVHAHSASQNPMHYESISPESFGRTRTFSLDHMSGLSSIKAAFAEINQPYEVELAKKVLTEVKQIGESGRCVSRNELGMIINSYTAIESSNFLSNQLPMEGKNGNYC